MRKRIVSILLTVAMLVSVLSLGTIGVSAANSSTEATVTTANNTINGVTVSGGAGSFKLTVSVADAVNTVNLLLVATEYIPNLDTPGVSGDPEGVAAGSAGAFAGKGGNTASGSAGNKVSEFNVKIPASAIEDGEDYGYAGGKGGEYTIYATTSANSAVNMVATFKLDKNGDLVQPLAYDDGEVTLTVGVASNKSVPAATGGDGSYTYELVTGSTMPDGLTLNENGTISGTPTTVGDTTISVKVTSGAETQTANVTIKVGKGKYAKPDITATAATAADAADGKITINNLVAGATYEYSKDGGAYTEFDLKGGKVISGLAAGSYSVRVKGNTNYNESDPATVTVTAPGAPVATITDLEKTYNGQVQKATVKVTVDGADKTSEYTITYTNEDGDEVEPKEAGNYAVTVTKDAKTIGTDTLVIAPAEPTAPEFADEIIVDETTLGDVMKNGELELDGVNGEKVTGTFTWLGDVTDDTPIVPGTKYQWKFETDNTNYLGLTGEISWVLENDEHAAYMFGTNAAKTIFQPNRGMTRAEVAVMIANLEEYDKTEDYEALLSAIPQDLKAEKANLEKWTDNGYNKICFILSEGIMQGRSNGNFDPYGIITRQEMAIVLGKYLGIAKYEGADLLNDLDNSAVYAEGKAYINALKEAKKIDGFPDGGYHPTENLTRAQAAKMMNYAMDRAPDITKMKAANVKTSFEDVQKFAGIDEADWALYNIIEASVTHAVSDYH